MRMVCGNVHSSGPCCRSSRFIRGTRLLVTFVTVLIHAVWCLVDLFLEDLAAHWTFALTGLGLDPVADAVHVEAMRALPNDCRLVSLLCRHVDTHVEQRYRRCVLIGQSSPGYLHFAHVPSNCTRQMPQVSSESSGRSHFHSATAW